MRGGSILKQRDLNAVELYYNGCASRDEGGRSLSGCIKLHVALDGNYGWRRKGARGEVRRVEGGIIYKYSSIIKVRGEDVRVSTQWMCIKG